MTEKLEYCYKLLKGTTDKAVVIRVAIFNINNNNKLFQLFYQSH